MSKDECGLAVCKWEGRGLWSSVSGGLGHGEALTMRGLARILISHAASPKL